MAKNNHNRWPYVALGTLVAEAALYYRKQKLARPAPSPLAYASWYGIDDRNGAAHLQGNDLKYADLRDSNLTGANLE